MNQKFVEITTGLKGAWLRESIIHRDQRGLTKEIFDLNFLPLELKSFQITQLLEAVSKKNTIRGVHFSSPTNPQIKLVSCLKGAILDCIIDLRVNSTTFGKTEIFELSEASPRVLILSPGFGHAYQVLSESATVFYALETKFNFKEEYTINPLDKSLNFPWIGTNFILSKRDQHAQSLDEALAYLKSFQGSR